MAKLYRALTDIHCPADPESWKNRVAFLKGDSSKGEKVKWTNIKAGDKVEAPSAEIAKSWLENAVVEEVK